MFLEQGTEHSQSTTRKGDEMLLQRETEDREQGRKQGIARSNRKGSTFVAIGALLGIKSVRGDAEHIVALDADTVDHGADDGLWPGFNRTRWMGIGDFFGVRLSCHGAILA